MSFLKALFGSKEENPEKKEKEEAAKKFNILKYDGVKALGMGQFEYAIRCFEAALGIQEDLEIRDYLSRALMNSNELEGAFQQLQKLADVQPDNQDILIRMAHVAYMQEDYSTMAETCQKVIDLNHEAQTDNQQGNGSLPLSCYLYAKAFLGMDETVKAIDMLTQAIEKDETYGDAYLLRGETLLALDDIERAEKDAEWLMEHTTDNEDVLMLKARIENAKDNDREALILLDEVIDLNPFNTNALQQRSEIKEKNGDITGAENDRQRIQEINPATESEDLEKKMNDVYKSANPLA